jgi:hypothetical protein
MRRNTYIVTATVLLVVALVLSLYSPLMEGFQAKKEDLCAVLKKGKGDISTQLDQANALMTDANAQLAKIKAALDDVSKLTTSFEC